MTILLRRASLAPWLEAATDPGRRADVIASFERAPQDVDGLSVFEVADPAQLALVVAGIACSRAKDNTVDLLEIPRSLAEEFGPIADTPTYGDTPVPSANALHRSLNWDNATLRRFAEALLEGGLHPKRHTRADVRAAVATLEPERDLLPGANDAKAFVESMRKKAARPPG